MSNNAGEVIMLREKSKAKDVLIELAKAKRKGYNTFYCSNNVYQSFINESGRDPYNGMTVTHIAGMRVFVSGTMFDNILILTKMDIYKQGQ